MKGQNASKNCTGKTDSILSCFYTQNLPQKKTTTDWAWTTESLSQAIPQFHGHNGFFSAFCGALSPSLGSLRDLRGMGQHRILSLPLPWIPSGSQGMGRLEVEVVLDWISRRYRRRAPKKQTGFGLPMSNAFAWQYGCPLLSSFGSSLWGSAGGEQGGQDGSAAHCVGCAAGLRPWPKP